MWTCNVESFGKENGNVVAVVVFTPDSGEPPVKQTFRADTLTHDRLRVMCGQWIASRSARDASFATLSVGPIDPIMPEA